ncbi:nuclear receptor coactivator 5 [Aplochiton taeniatus]
MSLRRSRSSSPPSRSTSSNNPQDLERRIFVGNLPTDDMDRKDLKELFSSYGKINGVSMFRGYGFVQFDRVEEAEAAKAGHKGRLYKGYKLDVNMAAERRQPKPQLRQSPPRSNSYGSYREGRDSRPRSRSPVHGRDHRDAREPRPRDHDDRYRGTESREKDLRADPRDPAYREEGGYERYYRGAGEEYYRKKEDPYRDPYSRDPWNGRREPDDARVPVEDRRRNELYRQYYEELQRRYDTERPVDCSVIVVNKAQKEYAETVGRKVRDLGMVVDLIFLNTEVSLTQALEDVGRARTPFAIIITQQHQVHRSCTVNILYGTPQEHRNMPMQDAMVLVADNYDSYKVEHRDKEREEISRKAAKMADEVLIREPDRESHPVSLLPAITLLSESRFLTPEELDSLISYLRDKRDRMVRGSVDPLTAALPVSSHHEAPPTAPVMSSAGHAPPQPSHMALTSASNPPPNPNHQQELQAKILSLFNSGGGAAASTASPSMAPQPYSMSSQLQHQTSGLPPTSAPLPSQSSQMMGARPPMRPPGAPPAGMAQAYGLPPAGRMVAPQGGQRPPAASSGINFDNPSVQKALDTLILSGPSFNNLVNPGNSPQAPRPGMGQPPPMAMYPRHY